MEFKSAEGDYSLMDEKAAISAKVKKVLQRKLKTTMQEVRNIKSLMENWQLYSDEGLVHIEQTQLQFEVMFLRQPSGE